MLTVFTSVSAARQAIDDPSSLPAGNTGGPPQKGPWHVDACYSYTGPPTTGNAGNTANTGNTGNTGGS
jgi:hypothetical protein